MTDVAAFRPIDCDLHVTVPNMTALLPYLDDYWRDHLTARGTDQLDLPLTSYPPNAPLTARADWRANKLTLPSLQKDALDAFGSRFAICHTINTAQMFYSEDMAAALCRALNDYVAREWLDKDERLRASIVVPVQNPELAAREIDRCAADPRFVEVQLLLMGEIPLGRRYHWPIYETAQKHNLPIGIHAGSSYRHAPTPTGWPSYFLEDYVANSYGFQGQLLNLIAEGVFVQFPDLKVVLVEAGFTWLPGFLWPVDKTWRGVRREVPWVKEPPSATVRRNVRFTLQPCNAPPDVESLERILEHINCDDLLLFSTDYPHWHFDGREALPKGLPQHLLQKILVDNPLATYPRLSGALAPLTTEVAT